MAVFLVVFGYIGVMIFILEIALTHLCSLAYDLVADDEKEGCERYVLVRWPGVMNSAETRN